MARLVDRLVDQVSSYRPAVIAVDILYSEETNSQSLITPETFARSQPYVYHALAGQPAVVQTREGVASTGPSPSVLKQLQAGTAIPPAAGLGLVGALR